MVDFFIKRAGVEQVWHMPDPRHKGAPRTWLTYCGRLFRCKGTNVVREVRPEAVCDLCKAAVARGD